jgi:hypothetical protein
MGDEAAEQYRKLFLEEQTRNELDRKAIMEEYKRSVPKDYSPEDIKEKIRELMAEAFATMKRLMTAEKESVQFAAAKYVFDIGIGQVKISDENDPDKALVDLLKQLNDPKAKDDSTADNTATN